MTSRAKRPFTGYHMTAILIGFFGVVIAVNVLMARLAIGSFGGTVVENSYVASQHYNQWLAAAERQEQLGWTATVERLARGNVAVAVRERGAAGEGFSVTAVARHPLGRAPERKLRFEPRGDGSWISLDPLPRGRWTLHLELAKHGDTFKQVIDLP